jgi:hypothetical protein
MLSRHYIAVFGSIIIAAISFTMSYTTCNWLTFSRSGSLIVALAVSIEYWPIIKTSLVDKLSFWTSQEKHTANRITAILAITGTLIWGFGDLLTNLIQCAI